MSATSRATPGAPGDAPEARRPGRRAAAAALSALLSAAVACAAPAAGGPAPAARGALTAPAADPAPTAPPAAAPATPAAPPGRAADPVPAAAPAVPAAPAGTVASAPGPPARAVDYLWVVRTALVTPASVESVVVRARAMGVRGLLVQVVGRGDAWYRSTRLPRAEALGGGDFDPLGALLPRAHAAGLEVHAWMNCLLVWSGPKPPRDPRHVVNAHAEWVARLADGRRLGSIPQRRLAAMGFEGVFLAPGHPEVRRWVAGIAGEIARAYPVDGIHLDYIRQPSPAVGYDPTTRARFALRHGADPARFAALPAAERDALHAAWREFQREQVSAVVAEVRDTLESVRPGLPLSAAVLADTARARDAHAQAWGEWLTSGRVDRVFVMCYAPEVQVVLDQLVGYADRHGASDRVVPGIAVYNSPPAAAAAKILGARALGFPALAVYSYDSLAARPGYWPRLAERLAARVAGP